jgi:hypothetical protein
MTATAVSPTRPDGGLAALLSRLAASGAYTEQGLGECRGDHTLHATRGWLADHVAACRLFTVATGDGTLVPSFQLSETGEPRPELAPLLGALAEGGVGGWGLWSWMTSPTSLLSGDVPEQIASNDPARALRAAQRFAA